MQPDVPDLLAALIPSPDALLPARLLRVPDPQVQGAVQLPVHDAQQALHERAAHEHFYHGIHLVGLGVHLLLPDVAPPVLPVDAALLPRRVPGRILGVGRAPPGPRRVPVLGARQRRQPVEGRRQKALVEGHAGG